MNTASDQNQATPDSTPTDLPAAELHDYVASMKICDVHGKVFMCFCDDCNIHGGPNADHTLEMSPRQRRRFMN